MKYRLGLLVALLTIAAPAFAQTITIDYDRDYSFEKVKTFSYVETQHWWRRRAMSASER